MKQAEAVRLMSGYPQFHSAQDANGGDLLSQHVAQALQYERMAHALQQADADIAKRTETGEVAGFVEKFLETQWRLVLAYAYCESDDAGEAQIRKWMDDLIWSVQPKLSNEQCQDMLSRLPGLLEALGTTLDLSEWHGPEREAFFTRLAERHAIIVRGAGSPRARVEFAVNSAQKASERRWEHESLAQAIASDTFLHAARAMQVGDCIEMLSQAEIGLSFYKLAWSSPRKKVLVLIEQGGQDFCSLTTEQLAERLKNNSARLMPG
jgi:hypothetical protein